jgi:hypothetical protein
MIGKMPAMFTTARGRRRLTVGMATLAWVLAGPPHNDAAASPDESPGLAAFETVRQVFQHPRCQNCHIPGDAPLQLDEGRPHGQRVQRGVDGRGAAGLPCSTCHAARNPPSSYGANMPPGAPNWHLPPARTPMVFVHLTPAQLCSTIKDPKATGGRGLPAMLEHLVKDELVAWGWDPGVGRAPVPVAHSEVVAAFRRWMDAGAPCPTR